MDRPVPEKLDMGFLFYGQEVLQVEGDIGGYPIPQYRQKKWQIPKYRVKNRRNTRYRIYDWLYIRLSISRAFFYLEHVYTINQPQPRQENVKRYLEFLGITIEKPDALDEILIPF